MSSQPQCRCGIYVHHGPVLCEECTGKVERQLADVMTGLVALSPSLANDPRPVSLSYALQVVTAEYATLIQLHAEIEDELAEAQAQRDALWRCSTCEGTGIMQVVVGVRPPDGSEIFESVACGECAGCGIGGFAQVIGERDALNVTLEQARDLAFRACKNAVVIAFDTAGGFGEHASLGLVMTEIAKAYALAALDATGKEAGR